MYIDGREALQDLKDFGQPALQIGGVCRRDEEVSPRHVRRVHVQRECGAEGAQDVERYIFDGHQRLHDRQHFIKWRHLIQKYLSNLII